ncbi:MAG: hypothetical protein QG637_1788 [Chloroflexota bacterium]|nr:hypothetical protein [Chloroflexota bacterium]
MISKVVRGLSARARRHEELQAAVTQLTDDVEAYRTTVAKLLAERDEYRGHAERLSDQSQTLSSQITQIISERDELQAHATRLSQERQSLLDSIATQATGLDGPVLTADEMAAVLHRSFPLISHEGRLTLMRTFCDTLGRYALENGVFQLDAYEIAEQAGLHLLAAHYYSPIARLDEVRAQSGRELFDDSFGLPMDRQAQLRFLDAHVFPHLHELTSVTVGDPGTPGRYFWSNGMYGVQDACTYYGIVRSFQPRQVLEVGSGFSTLVAAMAASRNAATTVTCIEPFPVEFFSRHLRQADGYELIEKMVQDVPLEVFHRLEANDILFLDSSHVVKPGSDVEYLIYRVLPALRPGVLVHFHDIFLPRGYLDYYYVTEHRHWNENFILAAYLARNPDWEILAANAFLADYGAGDLLCDYARAVSPGDAAREADVMRFCGGGGIWLRRR